MQKLFYLPEAHTDFVFAVFAEEFGLVGAAVMVALFLALVWRIFRLAMRAVRSERFWQRQPLGREEPHVHTDIDESLEAEPGAEPDREPA